MSADFTKTYIDVFRPMANLYFAIVAFDHKSMIHGT